MRLVRILTAMDETSDLILGICLDHYLVTSGISRAQTLDYMTQLFLGYGVMSKEFNKDFLAELGVAPDRFFTEYRFAPSRDRHQLDIEPILNAAHG